MSGRWTLTDFIGATKVASWSMVKIYTDVNALLRYAYVLKLLYISNFTYSFIKIFV